MQRHTTILALAFFLAAAGCDNHNARRPAILIGGQHLETQRNAVLASARQTVAVAREFDQLFSGGHTSVGEGRFGWDYSFEVGLYDRYVIQGQVPLTVDTNTMVVVGSGPPVIHVGEVRRVIPSSDVVGGSATFTTNQAQLGAEEWRKLVASHGDFTVVGYPMVTNMPIPYFDRVFRFQGTVKR